MKNLEIIWNALCCYREDCISDSDYDQEWDDICSTMALIEESLNPEEWTGLTLMDRP